MLPSSVIDPGATWGGPATLPLSIQYPNISSPPGTDVDVIGRVVANGDERRQSALD